MISICKNYSKNHCMNCPHSDYCDIPNLCNGDCKNCDITNCENNPNFRLKDEINNTEGKIMKNLKELPALLSAIYCINRTNGHEDEDIRNLIDYTFRRILGGNTNLLLLACINKTKETLMPEINQLLKKDTNYFQDKAYREAIRK